MVKCPSRERQNWVRFPHCRGFFFSRLSYTSDLKFGTLVATLPSALRYMVSAGTGRSGVITLCLSGNKVWSVASISVWQQSQLSEQIYWYLAGTLCNRQQTTTTTTSRVLAVPFLSCCWRGLVVLAAHKGQVAGVAPGFAAVVPFVASRPSSMQSVPQGRKCFDMRPY